MNDTITPTDGLLPYASWAEEALRAVVVEALDHAGRKGLPGDHHFYVTFRTDFPGVTIPPHLKARYPQEMTIVLQHKFWELKVNREARLFSVGLSFGGVPSMLTVPFLALTAFADPHVRFGLRFQGPAAEAVAPEPASEPAPPPPDTRPQVVSLDAFRRKRD